MSPNLDREAAIFQKAAMLPSGGKRKAYLDEACGSDRIQYSRIVELLEIHDAGAASLEPAEMLQTGAFAADETRMSRGSIAAGTSIGPYKLVEAIGEGGFGIVYLAEQEKPLKRRVALKVIKPGMDTAQIIARFETERQVLAMMEHPNIARVIDAGETEAGRPYFVMELVQGVPITTYCDGSKLTIRQRLELFHTVCMAVQHAHQKGIIHRDLKPSNILVADSDGQAVPKIIDFGVAKATAAHANEATTQTQAAQFIGTPLYMSPEQASLSPAAVDVRTDVYSLGVLLYELLTGTTPFDAAALRAAGLDEMRRRIREEDPPNPSDRISALADVTVTSISKQRSAGERQLKKLLHGELGWIVMRALEKDRTRRYESASELAADADNYLQNKPVAASPPSTFYRLSKFGRRHSVAVTTSAIVVPALLISTIVSMWRTIEVRIARAQVLRKAKAEQVALDDLKAARKREEVSSRLVNAGAAAAREDWELVLTELTRCVELAPDDPTILTSLPADAYKRRGLEFRRRIDHLSRVHVENVRDPTDRAATICNDLVRSMKPAIEEGDKYHAAGAVIARAEEWLSRQKPNWLSLRSDIVSGKRFQPDVDNGLVFVILSRVVGDDSAASGTFHKMCNDPDDAWKPLRLKVAASFINDSEVATKALQFAPSIAERTPPFHEGRHRDHGISLYRGCRSKEAIEQLEADKTVIGIIYPMDRFHHSARASYALAMAHHELGNQVEAIKAFQQGDADILRIIFGYVWDKEPFHGVFPCDFLAMALVMRRDAVAVMSVSQLSTHKD